MQTLTRRVIFVFFDLLVFILMVLIIQGGMVSTREERKNDELETVLQPPLDSVESPVVYTNAIASLRIKRKWFGTEEGLGTPSGLLHISFSLCIADLFPS